VVCRVQDVTTKRHRCGERLCWSCRMQADDDLDAGLKPACSCAQVLTLF
jgi:hypothetical protein